MKLLAMLHSPAPSGADTTIRRIAAHLTESGHEITMTSDRADPEELARVAKNHDVDMLLGTHALFSGEPFLETGLPYVLVLGGTDVNEFTLDPASLEVMTEAVHRAAGLVVFNEDFQQRSAELWPRSAEKTYLIPQGVSTEPSDFSLRSVADLPEDGIILLLPSGLRPVKDPLLLISCVRKWYEDDPRIRLIISGLSYDEDFEGIVRRRCGPGPAVQFVGPLARADLHAAMLEATAVLNTSLSECSPNAVLEAMDLRRPVVVRDIPGNTCLVEHGSTGLVFTGPDDFREQVQRLLDEDGLAAELGQRGQSLVRRSHSLGAERAAYAAVFRDLFDGLPHDARSRSHDVVVPVGGGVDLCAQTFGAPADPAVLLIAGAAASMLEWETEFCERLAAGSRFVIRYDHRDTGRSVRYPPGEPPYALRDLASDAVGLLDGLRVGRAHLVGISLGGQIAQLVALDHPARTASLTVLASSPGEPEPGAPGSAYLPPPLLDVLIELDELGVPDWRDREAVLSHSVAAARARAGSRDFDELSARRLAGRVFDRAPESLESATNHRYLDPGEAWRPRLTGLAAQTLVIHGDQDPIFPLPHGRALAAEIPDAALLVLDGAGHELARADWESVIDALLAHTERTY